MWTVKGVIIEKNKEYELTLFESPLKMACEAYIEDAKEKPNNYKEFILEREGDV